MAKHFLKKTTGLTGLEVAQHPHRVLTITYGKLLRTLERMPQTAAYKKYTQPLVEERLEHVKNEPDIEKLEKKIGMGQIEEVIIQAKSELSLARTFIDHKPWEELVEKAPSDQWRWPV